MSKIDTSYGYDAGYLDADSREAWEATTEPERECDCCGEPGVSYRSIAPIRDWGGLLFNRTAHVCAACYDGALREADHCADCGGPITIRHILDRHGHSCRECYEQSLEDDTHREED